MEYWQYIIPVITSVLGYFFGKWDTERKRKWELDDRDYNRQLSLVDSRIEDSKAYIDTYLEACKIIGIFELIQIRGDRDGAESLEVIEQMHTLDTHLAPKMNGIVSLYSLGDEELIKVIKQMMDAYKAEKKNAEELEQMIENNQSVNKDVINERVVAFGLDTGIRVAFVRMKLEKIAEYAGKK